MYRDKQFNEFYEKVIENKITDEITTSQLIQICSKSKYLPKNNADTYYFISILIEEKVLTKLKNGMYQVNLSTMKKQYTERVERAGQRGTNSA